MSKFSTNIDTLLSTDRVCNLIKYSARASEIDGDFVEFGVYRGGSLEILAKHNPSKTVFGLDSFVGLPEESEHDFHKLGDFHDVDYHAISGYFKMMYNNVRLVKGFSPKVFEFFEPHHRFAFAHIDVDLYQSVVDACDFFFPRMSPSGIILFDDFKYRGTAGAQKAILEFFENRECQFSGEVADPDGKTNHQFLVIK